MATAVPMSAIMSWTMHHEKRSTEPINTRFNIANKYLCWFDKTAPPSKTYLTSIQFTADLFPKINCFTSSVEKLFCVHYGSGLCCLGTAWLVGFFKFAFFDCSSIVLSSFQVQRSDEHSATVVGVNTFIH